MEKKLDLSKSVYDLVKEYPEVTEIMKSLGFSEITNKVMLNSVGKIMTIPKGAKMKRRIHDGYRERIYEAGFYLGR